MLEQAIERFNQNGDKARFLTAVCQYYEVEMIDSSVEVYLCNPKKEPGIYHIKPFSEAWRSWNTFEGLFGKFGDAKFPGICIGYDTSGVEFWLMLESGRVITLHHDATFSEVAWEIEADDREAFVWDFTEAGSIFRIDQLLALQAASRYLAQNTPDFEQRFFEATAQSLGWSESRLKRNIYAQPLEMVSHYCGF